MLIYDSSLPGQSLRHMSDGQLLQAVQSVSVSYEYTRIYIFQYNINILFFLLDIDHE